MSPRSAFPPLGLAAAVLVYLVLRGSVLGSRFNEICLPAYELTMVGNVAHSAATGWSGPPLAGFYDNCGGHLLWGLAGAPLFALLGDSYLVLKLVPLLVGLASMGLLWAILAPRAGRGAATLACLTFALGPPLLTRLSVMALGNHFEGVLPMLACYLAWLRWQERGRTPRDARLFGLVAGLAVFLYFGSLLWLALLAVGHLRAHGGRGGARDALRALPGLALGLVPLGWILWATDLRPLAFLDYNLGGGARASAGRALERGWEVATEILPNAGLYPALGPLSGRWAEAAFLLASALAWCVVARAAWTRGAAGARYVPLALYTPALIAVFAMSRFDFDPLPSHEVAIVRRYLAPYLALTILSMGFAYGELTRAPRPRRTPRLATVLAGLLVCTAPFALAVVLPPSEPSPSGSAHRGWSGRFLARVLLRDVRQEPHSGRRLWDFADLAARLGALPPAERPEVAYGLGYHLAWSVPEAPLTDVGALTPHLPGELVQQAHEGVGSFLRAARRARLWDAAGLHAFLLEQWAEQPRAARDVARGLAREFEPPLGRPDSTAFAQSCALGCEVPAELRSAWSAGLREEYARVAERDFAPELAAARCAFERLPPELLAELDPP